MSDKPKGQWVHEQDGKFQTMCARAVLQDVMTSIDAFRAISLLEEFFTREELIMAAQSYIVAQDVIYGLKNMLTNPNAIKEGEKE